MRPLSPCGKMHGYVPTALGFKRFHPLLRKAIRMNGLSRKVVGEPFARSTAASSPQSCQTEPELFVPEDVPSWYHQRFFRFTWLSNFLAFLVGSPLGNPKIFATLKNCPAYQYAAIDAWRRAMWHTGGLPRRTREAIAVAVSTANQCLY